MEFEIVSPPGIELGYPLEYYEKYLSKVTIRNRRGKEIRAFNGLLGNDGDGRAVAGSVRDNVVVDFAVNDLKKGAKDFN